jgi:choline transporter-like protein 2/4/5
VEFDSARLYSTNESSQPHPQSPLSHPSRRCSLGLLTGYFYYKAGLVTITIPESVSAQLSTYSSTASGAVSSLTYYVPVSFDTGLDSTTAYKVLAGISTAVSLIVLVMVVALRSAIATAIRIIKLGAEALQSLPSLVCFPLTTVLALGLFVMWWIFVAASLATAGNTALVDASKEAAAGLTVLAQQTGISANTVAAFTNSTSLNQTFTYIEDMPTMNYLLIYHVFGLLWTTQWLVGMATITIAGGVSAWYFSRVPAGMHPPPAAAKALSASVTPVSSGETPSAAAPAGPASLYALERFPVIASLCRAIRYYMGTVAFAALLIAIMQVCGLRSDVRGAATQWRPWGSVRRLIAVLCDV